MLGEARKILGTGLAARAAEGYPRAYDEAVKAQMVVELDEAVSLLRIGKPRSVVDRLTSTWSNRLRGCRRDHHTWYKTLMVRSIVLDPHEIEDDLLEFASLSRKAGRLPMASETLRVRRRAQFVGSLVRVRAEIVHHLDAPT